MQPDKIKGMLDACYLEKRIRELLPELPNGVIPAYIQYMDVIHNLQRTGQIRHDRGTVLNCGNVVIPFDNQISKDTSLYKLYNTNLHEKISEMKKKEKPVSVV